MTSHAPANTPTGDAPSVPRATSGDAPVSLEDAAKALEDMTREMFRNEFDARTSAVVPKEWVEKLPKLRETIHTMFVCAFLHVGLPKSMKNFRLLYLKALFSPEPMTCKYSSKVWSLVNKAFEGRLSESNDVDRVIERAHGGRIALSDVRHVICHLAVDLFLETRRYRPEVDYDPKLLGASLLHALFA